MIAKKVTSKKAQIDLRIGDENVTMSEAIGLLEVGRAFAPLSMIRSRIGSERYWISTQGVPIKPGYYRDNGDGTFTKTRKSNRPTWAERLYVTQDAAKHMSEGNGPLLAVVEHIVTIHPSRIVVAFPAIANSTGKVASVHEIELDIDDQSVKNAVRQ